MAANTLPEITSEEQIEEFCGDCEQRGVFSGICKDGVAKQIARVQRGNCIRAIVDGKSGMMTNEDGFTQFPSAR